MSRVTRKIWRNIYFCALNKKSFVTECKRGEVVSKFIITTLLRMTNFETVKYLDGNMPLPPVFSANVQSTS